VIRALRVRWVRVCAWNGTMGALAVCMYLAGLR
jgi:hypothetical protein